MTTLVVDNSNDTPPVLTLDLLRTALREIEPGALLLPAWILQDVIAFDRGLGKRAFHSLDSKFHIIARSRLAEIVTRKGVDLPGEIPVVETVVLLVRPQEDWLRGQTASQGLRHYWRLLFHGRVSDEVCRKLTSSAVAREAIEDRIERIGRGAFNEARFVLHRERRVPFTASEIEAYVAFAAAYLEMHSFQPDLLHVYFPSLSRGPAILNALSADVDSNDLLRRTRLAGSAEPHFRAVPATSVVAEQIDSRDKDGRDESLDPKLLVAADRAASAGNIVRAAILRQIASAGARENYVCAAARHDLKRLVERLAASVHLDEEESARWRAALAPLLPRCTDGWWNQEARLLYDLQKVCVNHEREIYSTSVVEWAMEFGRRGLRRPQPNQRIVLMDKALRSALHRLPHARISAAERETLAELLHGAIHHNETHLRDKLRPAIAESLNGDLSPAHAVEVVAEKKLVEDLLDGLTHRGFITLSNVRDAVANNQIKFPDVKSPRAFAGDPLFRIDRRLSDRLDGVYHRGEVYLWFFQKVSSLFFATNSGRFITRTILMPLGGSFIILEAFDHTLFLLLRKLTGLHWLKLSRLESLKEHFKDHTMGAFFSENVPFLFLAVVLLGAINLPAFRAVVFRVLRWVGLGLKAVLFDVPRWIVNRPLVQAIIQSRAMESAMRYIVRPALVAGIVSIFLPGHLVAQTRWSILAGIFVGANLLLNSRPGRAIEHAFRHWLRVVGNHITTDIFMNLFSGVMHFFQRRLEDFDRMLYAVDEWLRFRAGQSNVSLALKATLGIGWFYVAYFSRFVVNLLIEPQINPIKHFPVVTVSHKIVLPTVGLFASALETAGLSVGRARTLAGAIVTTIPGIFGYLAWELRANWKLYGANRATVLKPVQVGSHGESLARLLRPGFHSGTVPKLFARLRKAHRQIELQDSTDSQAEAATHKHLEAVEHVGQAVGHFIEREFLALLNQHPAWKDFPLSLAGVNLCATRITIEVSCPSLDMAPMRIFFEQRAGWILAGIEQTGWLRKASPLQARLFSAGLLGTYKIAGVDIMNEHLESLFAPALIAFEVTDEKLIVWPGRQFNQPLVLKLGDDAPVEQKFRGEQLLLSRASIAWSDWVSIWDVAGNGSPATAADMTITPLKGLANFSVLPAPDRS